MHLDVCAEVAELLGSLSQRLAEDRGERRLAVARHRHVVSVRLEVELDCARVRLGAACDADGHVLGADHAARLLLVGAHEERGGDLHHPRYDADCAYLGVFLVEQVAT